MMKILTIFFLLTCGLSNGQTFSKCNVYQFAGTDSAKKLIALKQTFNPLGQLTSESYNNFKKNSAEGSGDGSYFYFYEDTLLIKRTFVDDNKDSTKMLCYYNNNKQLVKQEHFTFERRIKKDAHKGLGQSGGCIVIDADYEKNRTWEKTSEINYSYDSNGHKILYDATKLHYTSQNRYTWIYDSLGRVLEYSSFEDQKLIWIEKYSYFKNEYKFTRTWYDYDENPISQYTDTFYLDKKGRVVKEITNTEKNEKVSTETTTYNLSGQISRTVYLNEKGVPEITHIYIYH